MWYSDVALMLEAVSYNLLFEYQHWDYFSKSALNNFQLNISSESRSYFEVSSSRSQADTITHLLV